MLKPVSRNYSILVTKKSGSLFIFVVSVWKFRICHSLADANVEKIFCRPILFGPFRALASQKIRFVARKVPP